MVLRLKLDWKTDNLGQLLLGGIHDGELIDLSFRKGFLAFRIQGVDASVVLFELRGLHDLHLGLWNGAIINDISIWNVMDLPESLLTYGDAGWNYLLKDRISPVTSVKEQAEKIIKSHPSALFLQIECSFGKNIAVVCDQIAIYKVGLDDDLSHSPPASPG